MTIKNTAVLWKAMLLAASLLGAGPAQAQEAERVIVVRKGDTLAGLLLGAGMGPEETHAAVGTIAALFPPKSLRAGQEVAIRLDPERDDALVGLEVEPAPGRTVRARLREGGWQAEEVVAPQQRMLALAGGTVDGGLFPSAVAAGLPPGLALAVVRLLGHQVDFQRDFQPGDTFSILFERFRGEDGDVLGHGQVLQVGLVLSGRPLSFWRHERPGGAVEWFDAEGRSLRRSFLRTPLDGARISSGFGPRSHPMLGYNRMHAGIDFAAPTGTRVYAAADGVVASARREGGYGNIVRLRHRDGTETRYAHLSGFPRGLAPRRAVRQGDVIGFVGSTGLSTGPHLHYEIAVRGRPVDPRRHVIPPARLAGRDLAAFRAAQLTLARHAARIGPELAEVALSALPAKASEGGE